jgi:hypothetical protein
MLLPRIKFFLQFSVFLFVFVIIADAQSGKPKPTPPKEDDDTEKVLTEEIKLNFSAFDPNGKFFAGVNKEDLVIVEDGILHQASSVRRIPANVLIVLDTGGEDRHAKNINTTRETAKTLIKSLQVEDSVALLEYHDQARILTEWTTDKAQLLTALDKNLNFGRRSRFV